MANQLVSEVTNPATVSNFNISNNLVQALSFDKDLRNTLVHKGFLGLIIKKGYVVIDVEYIRDVVYKYDTQDNSSPEFQTEGIYEFSRDEYIPVKWYIKRSMRLALDMILSIIEQIENKVRDLGREQEFELYKSVYPINSRPGSVK